MFNGSRITKALMEDIDSMKNPKKWKQIDRKKKLKIIKRKIFFKKN